MNDVLDFFKDLFSTDLWPARWNCGYWSPFHGWLYIASDIMIWFAYFAIPVIILTYIYRKKYELKYTRTYFLFAAFILLCGSTHFLDATMFWIPVYRFNALVRFVTGIVSLFTVYHLIKILPDAFREKTNVVLQREIQKREEVEQQLAQANEGLRAFAYIASHDLQEPLRKISLYSSQLQEEVRATHNVKVEQLTNRIETASVRMGKMIRDILELSSLSQEVDLKTLSLDDVVQQALSDLEVKINERNAVIDVEALPTVHGNEEYLVQLFQNLINNAIKFSTDQPHVAIQSHELEDYIEIHVRDNGIGINEDDKDTIFEAFKRLHSRAAYEGSGIGLAICKRIVEIHKGTIRVESEPGKGSTFIITFPKHT